MSTSSLESELPRDKHRSRPLGVADVHVQLLPVLHQPLSVLLLLRQGRVVVPLVVGVRLGLELGVELLRVETSLLLVHQIHDELLTRRNGCGIISSGEEEEEDVPLPVIALPLVGEVQFLVDVFIGLDVAVCFPRTSFARRIEAILLRVRHRSAVPARTLHSDGVGVPSTFLYLVA